MSNEHPPGGSSQDLSVIDGGSERTRVIYAILDELLAPRPLNDALLDELWGKLKKKGKGKVQLAGGTQTFRL